MTSGNPRGGLRKRVEPFVQVRSKTVNHGAVSYRALGVLTYLLDKPEGWDVNAQQMAKGKGREGREGREAVRSALRELALAGYYRLERRQARSGKFAMGTAISETPVESWAEQARFFDAKAVPMVEQPDGTFLVKYPDGTLRPDDFPPPEKPTQEELFSDSDTPSGDDFAGGTEDGFLGFGSGDATGDGFSGSGFSGPGNPASGASASGNASPKTEGITQRGYTDSDQPSVDRPGGGDGERSAALQPALDGTVPAPRQPEKPAKEPTTHDVSMGIARGYLAYQEQRGAPVAGGRPLHQVASLVRPFLDAGYTEDEVKHALADLADQGIPSRNSMQRALVARRGLAQQRSQHRAGQGITNRHIDDITPEQRNARNPFAQAIRSSEVVGAGVGGAA
jgi:hypothetical protein